MANSMDAIKVKYSGSDEPVSIQEFMEKDPQKLNERERKIQEAVCLVYNLNDKEPPLYKSFSNPDVEKRSLVINCTGDEHAVGANAFFNPAKNEVCFINKFGNLVGTLAHELTHAEQHIQKEIKEIKKDQDNKAKKENWLMDEAEAFYTEAKVCSELGISNRNIKLYRRIKQEYTDKEGHKNTQKIKQKMMEEMLKPMTDKGHELGIYLKQTEMYSPVLDSDKGIETIPEYYGLTDDFLKVLNAIPREAQFDAGKIHQCFSNHRKEQILTLDISKRYRGQALKDLFDYLSTKDDATELHYLMNLKDKDGQLFFDTEAKVELFSAAMNRGKEYLDNIVQFFQDDQKKLPFTEEDLIIVSEENPLIKSKAKSSNRLLNSFNLHEDAVRTDIAKMLPEILKLKGHDGQPLIGKKHLILFIESATSQMGTPENLLALFDSIKNEKGNLPFSQEVFEVHDSKNEALNGSNRLLNILYSAHQDTMEIMKTINLLKIDKTLPEYEEMLNGYVSEEYCLGAIPILMALKDKDGKPIISQENIDKFPENSPLISLVRMHKRSHVKTGKSEKSNLMQTLSQNANQEHASNKKQLSSVVLKRRNTPQAGG